MLPLQRLPRLRTTCHNDLSGRFAQLLHPPSVAWPMHHRIRKNCGPQLNTSLQALPQVDVRLCRDLQGAKEPASALNIGQIVQSQVHRHTAPRVPFSGSNNPLEFRPVRGLHIPLERAAVVPRVVKSVEDSPTSSASPKFSLIRTSSVTPSAQVVISPVFCDNSRHLRWTWWWGLFGVNGLHKWRRWVLHSRHRLDHLGTTSSRGLEQYHSTENILAMCWPSAASSCADLVHRHQKWQGERHGIVPVGPSMLGIARTYGRYLQSPQGRCSAGTIQWLPFCLGVWNLRVRSS